MNKFQLRCLSSKDIVEDNYTLHYSEGALLVAEYTNKLSFSLQFLQILYDAPFTVTVRWSKGTDINAGCGQLANKSVL